MPGPLDRGDVQALVLRTYGRYCESRHHFFNFASRQAAGAFLTALTPMLAHGRTDIEAGPRYLLNIGLTWQGLLALGAFDPIGGEEAARYQFFVFNEPPSPEALKLSDRSTPSTWWNGRFATSDIHATVHVYARNAEALDEGSATVRAAASGVSELLPTSDGEAIRGSPLSSTGRQLHFGYEDGISYPDVNWDDDPAHIGLARRHFLLGEPGAQPSVEQLPFLRLGSFMALAWMYQDVARFNRFLREEGPRLAPDGMPQAQAEEWLAAKMMGRWRDGTPLVLSPDAPDASMTMRNDFTYADDQQGLKCPFAAHIRIVNGRDQPLNHRNQIVFSEGFPQVLRRGTPYGRAFEGLEDDGEDRGVLGMFICANLNKQFYSLTRWIGQTNFSDVYTNPRGQDPLVGDRGLESASADFEIPGTSGTAVVRGLPDFVRMQGVAFLLLPGIAGLHALASAAMTDR